MWSGHSCPLPLILFFVSGQYERQKKATPAGVARDPPYERSLLRRQKKSPFLPIVRSHANDPSRSIDTVPFDQYPS